MPCLPAGSLCPSWGPQGETACLGIRALTSCPGEAVLPFMFLSPSPPPLQIKSQDLFQSWVAQLRAHRLAMPRGSLPGTTHRKVRRALCRGR